MLTEKYLNLSKLDYFTSPKSELIKTCLTWSCDLALQIAAEAWRVPASTRRCRVDCRRSIWNTWSEMKLIILSKELKFFVKVHSYWHRILLRDSRRRDIFKFKWKRVLSITDYAVSCLKEPLISFLLTSITYFHRLMLILLQSEVDVCSLKAKCEFFIL